MNLNSIPSIDSSYSKNIPSVKINSLKDLENNPQFFPVWMAEIQRRNINNLLGLSVNQGDNSDSQNSAIFGFSNQSSDPLAALGLGFGLQDPLAGVFGSQGFSADFAFMSPELTLQSFQVNDTLKGLQDYSNAVETKKWLNQLITYVDPTDKLVKQGRIVKIDIENVSKPIFYTEDGTKLSLDEIKELNAELSTDLRSS